MACVHTHASYAGVVCSMEGTPWGLVLWLCSTGRWHCHRGSSSREVISWGYGGMWPYQKKSPSSLTWVLYNLLRDLWSIRLHLTSVLCPLGFSVFSLLEFPLSCFRSCESICCVRTGYAADLIRSTHVKVFRHLKVGRSAIILSFNVFASFPLPLKFWLAFPDLGVLTADCMFERLMKDGWSIIPDICIGMLLHGWITLSPTL